MSDKTGAVMVVGGGIAGMQAALDLADTGYFVYLVEKTQPIGGVMSQLDKTFPTNDCCNVNHLAQTGRGRPAPKHRAQNPEVEELSKARRGISRLPGGTPALH
jgi:heterodisulfide reductase subunit A-like polyferredoxin